MDIVRMKDILSRHQKTSHLYDEGAIWVGYVRADLVIVGTSPDAFITALTILTEDEPLYAQYDCLDAPYVAIITSPPTHVRVSAGTVRDSTIIGATINNLAPNHGVQGIVNTPIHIGKK